MYDESIVFSIRRECILNHRNRFLAIFGPEYHRLQGLPTSFFFVYNVHEEIELAFCREQARTHLTNPPAGTLRACRAAMFFTHPAAIDSAIKAIPNGSNNDPEGNKNEA